MINTYLYSNLNSASSLFEPMETLPTILTQGTLEALTICLLLLCFFSLHNLEIRFPKKNWPFKKLAQSYSTNISLFLFNNTVLSLLSVSTLLAFVEQHSAHGLLSQVTIPGWKIVLSFVLLDLAAYLWHVACHKLDCLWMFHKVHHSDPYLNVSTAFRLHIIELALFAVIKVAFIILTGIDKTTALASQAITTLFIMFHHTNISFSGEIQLSRLIIVPKLHRMHHSIERSEHDQNFGAVFSIWDRLFGTLTEGEPVAIGIKNNGSLGFFDQLKLGCTPNAVPSDASSIPEVSVQSMIAVAAYYKAQHRQFSPGNDIADWLEAEAEISKIIHI